MLWINTLLIGTHDREVAQTATSSLAFAQFRSILEAVSRICVVVHHIGP